MSPASGRLLWLTKVLGELVGRVTRAPWALTSGPIAILFTSPTVPAPFQIPIPNLYQLHPMRSGSPSRLLRPLRYVPASLSSLTDSILGNETTGKLLNPPTLSRSGPRAKVSPERADSRSLSPSMAPLTPPGLLGESAASPRYLRAYGPDSPLEGEGGQSAR